MACFYPSRRNNSAWDKGFERGATLNNESDHMTLAQRLIVLILTAVGCSLVLSGVSYFQINKVYDTASYATNYTLPRLEILNRANFSFLQARTRTLNHIVSSHVPSPDPEMKAQIEKTINAAVDETEKALKDYEAIVFSNEDKGLLEAEKATLADYKKSLELILAPSNEFRTEAALEEVAKGAPVAEKLSQSLLAHIKFNEELAKRGTDAADAAKKSSTLISLIVFAIALATLGLMGFGIVRSLTTRIAQANQVAERIAAGDLSPSNALTQIANDEIGQLLKSLEKMRNDLARTIGEIFSNAESVAGSANQLSDSSKRVSVTTETQTASTTAAAAAVEELTVSIDHIGTSASEANQRAIEAGSMAAESEKAVGAATRKISEVANQVDETSQQMHELSDQVQKIGTIAVVIREVADQTNLLALNAAIEAARAGEQGRGFAVVADEVRKLAERTTLSVQQISQVIATIQDGAKTAVTSMQSSRRVVSDVVISAGNASASMGEICGSSNTVRLSIETISEALREQKKTSTDLARNVEAIAQMSEQNASAVESVASTAQQLVQLSDVLKSSVARFRI